MYSNYIEVPMYILSAVFLTVLHRDCLCPSHGQWQAGTVSLLLAWITLLPFLNKWPFLGIYIGMLWQIVLRFLMVAFIIVLLLIAFMFAFYMAFYEPSLPVSIPLILQESITILQENIQASIYSLHRIPLLRAQL